MKKSKYIYVCALLLSAAACKNPVAEVRLANIEVVKKNNFKINWGEIDLDELGSPRLRVVLSLDYIPPKNSDTRLPACLPAFEPDFELAKAKCVEGAKTETPIRAIHVLQTCYTAPGFKSVPPKEPLRLTGCKAIRVMGHKFYPVLRLDFEPR